MRDVVEGGVEIGGEKVGTTSEARSRLNVSIKRAERRMKGTEKSLPSSELAKIVGDGNGTSCVEIDMRVKGSEITGLD